jgi:aminotransferase in exopolysaccharide biosynthesis
MSDFIPLSEPVFAGREWEYVKDCLNTGWVSSAGSYVTEFEEALADYVGTEYAVACVNGTAAIHVALRAAGVEEGDEVIVPTLTFIAPVNAVNYLGAHPVFIGCDDYYNLDVKRVIKFLEEDTYTEEGKTFNLDSGRRIRAILPVHVFGNPVDLGSLREVCLDKNIKIIEDATESLGSYYSEGDLEDSHTGSVGELGCFSFNGNKIITSGGGGMVVTDDKKMAEKVRYLTTQAKDDPELYIHNEVGYNYRLTNLQAALGLAQLEQLPGFIEKKRSNHEKLKKEINRISGLQMGKEPSYGCSNYWLYSLEIDKEQYGLNRNELIEHLRARKIESRPLWYLNHLQKPYENCQNIVGEKTVQLYENSLNIPSGVDLTQEDLARVITALEEGVKS